MGILEILKLVKEIGLTKAVSIISFLAWFLLPFWIWYIAFRLLGNGIFVFNIAVIGIVLSFAESIFLATQMVFWRHHEFGIMKFVEKAGILFRDPGDKSKAEEFKDECRKFILPFTHHLSFSLSAIHAGMRKRVVSIRFALSKLWRLYWAYSIATFLVVFRKELHGLFDFLRPVIIQIPYVQALTDWSYHNLWIVLALLWVSSLYHDSLIRLTQSSKRLGVSRYRLLLVHLLSTYDPVPRMVLFWWGPLLIPTFFAERARAVIYDPFVDPLTLPRIVQKTVLNVEGKNCDVTRWNESIETPSDVDRIKELTWKDRKAPFLLRMLAKMSQTEDLLERIKEAQPMTYVGIVGDRCVFLGHVVYNPIRRIRQARFYFDTTYLKKEFLLIFQGEAEKQRAIERELPSQFKEWIKD